MQYDDSRACNSRLPESSKRGRRTSARRRRTNLVAAPSRCAVCGIAFRGTPAGSGGLGFSSAPPIANRRYGRLQVCATIATIRDRMFSCGGALALGASPNEDTEFGSVSVAQIFNLPYRGIAFRKGPTASNALELAGAPPITNRRYGRLQVCATIRFGMSSFGDAPALLS
jgi:hypothetical protein